MQHILTTLTILFLSSFAFGQTEKGKVIFNERLIQDTHLVTSKMIYNVSSIQNGVYETKNIIPGQYDAVVSANATKSRKYSLFNPVPKDKMKEMETDRPDVTESAYTVEAGHFQVESDLFKHVRNRNNEMVNTGNVFNLGNYKLGLTERMDIQLVVPTYVSNGTRDLNTNKIINKTAGFDDLSLRFKYNIWGNAGGKTALAALPFLSFPTSSFSRNGIQGGIIFPFALKLQKGWDFGSQVETDIVREEDNCYHPDFACTFTFGKTISAKVSGFVEGLATYSTYFKNAGIYANGGLIFSISENFNIDAGFNYGINKDADKIYFTGFSFRL
jgi:hypothetical protein